MGSAGNVCEARENVCEARENIWEARETCANESLILVLL